MLGQFKSIIKSQLGGSSSDLGSEPPQVLQCSMTYVNVSWQSLAADFLKFQEL